MGFAPGPKAAAKVAKVATSSPYPPRTWFRPDVRNESRFLSGTKRNGGAGWIATLYLPGNADVTYSPFAPRARSA